MMADGDAVLMKGTVQKPHTAPCRFLFSHSGWLCRRRLHRWSFCGTVGKQNWSYRSRRYHHVCSSLVAAVRFSGCAFERMFRCLAHVIASCSARRYKPNGVVVALSLCFSTINIGCILIDWLVFSPFLVYVTLFYGVFIGWFSVRSALLRSTQALTLYSSLHRFTFTMYTGPRHIR